MQHNFLKTVLLGVMMPVFFLLSSCTTTNPNTGQQELTKTSKGALVGGATGAAVGAVAGGGEGAAIGAGIGAATGAAIVKITNDSSDSAGASE